MWLTPMPSPMSRMMFFALSGAGTCAEAVTAVTPRLSAAMEPASRTERDTVGQQR